MWLQFRGRPNYTPQEGIIWAQAKPARVANQATGPFKGPRLSTLSFRFGGVYKP